MYFFCAYWAVAIAAIAYPPFGDFLVSHVILAILWLF